MSHLETSDRDTDADNCSDGDVRVDDCDEDEENPPIECDFLSKNIYNVLNVQTTPPPTVVNADVTLTTTDTTTATAAEQTTSPEKCLDSKNGSMCREKPKCVGFKCWNCKNGFICQYSNDAPCGES